MSATTSGNPASFEAKEDIAPFAQVVTWDPNRSDGCRANRIQEFHAEDVFLETEVQASADGTYTVPTADNGLGCIGLQWIERWRLTALVVRFAETSGLPSPDDVSIEGWFGESQWQGGWQPMKLAVEQSGDEWRYDFDWSGMPDAPNGTRKVRLIFPAQTKPVVVRSLEAYTMSEWETAEIVLRSDGSTGGRAEVSMYNGRIVEPADSPYSIAWDMSAPLRLKVRYSAPNDWKSDRTVIRLQLPNGAFGIAVDDILANKAVCVREFGVSAVTGGASCEEPSAEAKTVLHRVRAMPDQTFEQAMAAVHNPVQDNGSTMVSLACDNSKFIVEQTGVVQFMLPMETEAEKLRERLTYPGWIVPQFGSGEIERTEQHVEDGWLPIPVSTFHAGGVDYRERTFVVPYGNDIKGAPWLNDKPLCVVEYTIENTKAVPADVDLALSFLQNGDEGTAAEVQPSAQGVVAQAQGCLLVSVDASGADGLNSELNENTFALTGSLPAGESTRIYVYIPAWRMNPEDHAELTGGDLLVEDVKVYWAKVTAPAARIEIPDEFLLDVIRASQVYCLIATRNEEQGKRLAPWIAAVSYGPLESEAHSIIRGMDFLGYGDYSRRSLDFYVHRYNPEGFLTTGYTMMGTGWHLWSLGEHYRLTRDGEWLTSIAPEVVRVCRWIVAQTEKTKKFDANGDKVPEYGLMPPGVLADWNAFAYHFSLSGFYYAGLHSAAQALSDIGQPEAGSLLESAEELRQNILRAYRWTQSRAPVFRLKDGSWAPEYPGQLYCPGPTNNFFPGEDGNRSWCYDVELGASQLVPHGVLDPNSDQVTWMMEHMEDVQFLANGLGDYPAEKSEQDWFNLGGFAKVQPYYCRNAEVYAMRYDLKPFIRSYFNTIGSLLNTQNMSFWEHFHNIAAWNKTHETGYFLYHSRLMLLMERGGELWLAPFVTNNWMKDGMVVAVKDAPTAFGEVSYRIKSHISHGYIEAEIQAPGRNEFDRLVIRLRHPDGKPMRSVKVNGKDHADFDPARECVFLNPSAGRTVVWAGY